MSFISVCNLFPTEALSTYIKVKILKNKQKKILEKYWSNRNRRSGLSAAATSWLELWTWVDLVLNFLNLWTFFFFFFDCFCCPFLFLMRLMSDRIVIVVASVDNDVPFVFWPSFCANNKAVFTRKWLTTGNQLVWLCMCVTCCSFLLFPWTCAGCHFSI